MKEWPPLWRTLNSLNLSFFSSLSLIAVLLSLTRTLAHDAYPTAYSSEQQQQRENSIASLPQLPVVSTVLAQDVIPKINAVSAMCSSDGITASITFDRAFTGRIYSRDYPSVHECVYYNGGGGVGQHTVLFSIPAHRCGTRLTRTSRNVRTVKRVIDQMENRVYVQMDRDTQTAADRQFAFVCQLAAAAAPSAMASGGAAENDVRKMYSAPPTPITPVQTTRTSLFSASSDMNAGDPLYDRRPPHPVNAYATSPVFTVPLVPVNAETVRRVAAVSRDGGHFGNWPIPGARPFSSEMRPAASYPLPPSPPRAGGVGEGSSRDSQAGVPSSWYATPRPPRLPAPAPRLVFAHSLEPAPTYAATESSNSPFLFSPLVGVRTEPVSMGSGSEVHAHSWSEKNKQENEGRKWTEEKDRDRGVVEASVDEYPSPPPTTSESEHNEKTTEQATTTKRPHSVSGEKALLPATEQDEITTSTTTAASAHQSDSSHILQSISASDRRRPSDEVIPSSKLPNVSTSLDLEATDKDSVHALSEGRIPSDRLVASQDARPACSEVFLEMQEGDGPGAPIISRPLKIGENITLVVRAKTAFRAMTDYDMFVHSCFATDGPGSAKVELIDKNGCVVRPLVVSEMRRRHDASTSEQLYFFRISAFKFPGPADVYFSCSVDMTPGRQAPEICAPSTSRRRRELLVGTASRRSGVPDGTDSLRLFDNVKVELADEFAKEEQAAASSSTTPTAECLDPSLIVPIASVILLLLAALIVAASFALRLYLRVQHFEQKQFPRLSN